MNIVVLILTLTLPLPCLKLEKKIIDENID